MGVVEENRRKYDYAKSRAKNNQYEVKEKSITLSNLITKLEQLKEEYGDIEIYYEYDGMNIPIEYFSHINEMIRVHDESGGYVNHLVPEHILIA